MRDIVANMVVNADELPTLYGETQPISSNPEYIIITNSALAPTFQRLADWKTIKGIKADIITTEWINETFEGDDLALKIKQAIYYCYNQGAKYILLGGDVDIVPTRICTIGRYGNNDVEDVASDTYFSCFDNNFEWDDNGNGIYGEIEDNLDYAPDIIISRLPCNTINDVEMLVNRYIKYETLPNIVGWEDKILLGGAEVVGFSDNSNMSDAHVVSLELYEKYIQPYWDGSMVSFFDTGTDVIGGFTPQNLTNELSKGYLIFNMDTHGSHDGWRFSSSPYVQYNKSLIPQINNSKYTVITSTSCETNAFDYDEACLGETFITNQRSGILAYIGNSRKGLFLISNAYFEKFYKNLFSDMRGMLGESYTKMKLSLLGNIKHGVSDFKYIFHSLNSLSDPELSIYLSQPKTFNPTISFSNNCLNVMTNLLDCEICVMKKTNIGISYYNVQTFDNLININNLEGEYTICLTKKGYIPYICSVGNNIFLQNDVINYNLNVKGNIVCAGNNVTSFKDNGDFIINTGKTIINYGDYIILDNGFEIKQGAELETKFLEE